MTQTTAETTSIVESAVKQSGDVLNAVFFEILNMRYCSPLYR